MDNTPFNKWRSQNYISGVEKDKFGNAKGEEYDLVKNNAFDGLLIAVLHLYTGEGFDFELPKKALEKKGFKLIHWKDKLPMLTDFKEALKTVSQLWLISNQMILLTEDYMEAIATFFYSGRGLYIWGDNDPYYADANLLSQKLFNVTMTGNYFADEVIGIQRSKNTAGLIANHEISTGIENIYEGITVATIKSLPHYLTPLVYSSNDEVVAALYDQEGRRAIIDGGFTRLYNKWYSAGTERYVVNTAAWLVNYERQQLKADNQQSQLDNILNKFQQSATRVVNKDAGTQPLRPDNIINKF